MTVLGGVFIHAVLFHLRFRVFLHAVGCGICYYPGNRNCMPDMFAEGREVVVEGRYDGRGLAARQIMTSCPSKYEPAADETGATPTRAGRGCL